MRYARPCIRCCPVAWRTHEHCAYRRANELRKEDADLWAAQIAELERIAAALDEIIDLADRADQSEAGTVQTRRWEEKRAPR